MKRFLIASTALFAASAAPAAAQSFTDQVTATLAEQGFQTREIKNGPTETKVEAVRGNVQLEVVYDRATGTIVEQEIEPFAGVISDNHVVEISTEEEDFSDRARGKTDDRDDDRDDNDDRDDDGRDDDDGDDDGRDHDDDGDRGRGGDDDGDDGDDSGRDGPGDGDGDSSGSDGDGDGDGDSGGWDSDGDGDGDGDGDD